MFCTETQDSPALINEFLHGQYEAVLRSPQAEQLVGRKPPDCQSNDLCNIIKLNVEHYISQPQEDTHGR